MKNIYIIGAQNTGKTTVVGAVAKSFANDLERPTPIGEVARPVFKQHKISREEIRTSPTLCLQLQHSILKAQHDAEISASGFTTSSWYMCDRSGLDPIAYAYKYVGAEAAAEMLQSGIWLDLEVRMKQGIVFLCEAGCDWLIDDGTRLMPTDLEDWKDVDNTFRRLLQERGIEYFVIPKDMVDLEERVQFVRSIIEASQGQELGAHATIEVEDV